MTVSGGRLVTPIDIINSTDNETKFLDDKAFSKKLPAFFKADVKIGYKLNGKKISQEWQVYVENVTNHQNILMETYSSKATNKIKNTYQMGFFPMVLYRLYF